MKNGSRGNYRILYRDLDPERLYSHFTVIETQRSLLDEMGMEPRKALKAVREMARVHFSGSEPDGLLEGKKAWKGQRWNALYQQWGDYLSERDRENAVCQVFLEPDEHKADDQISKHHPVRITWMNRLANQKSHYVNMAAAILIFCAGFFASQLTQGPASSAQADANPSQGMLIDEGNELLRYRELSEGKGKLLYFPNLEGTLAVFASKKQSFAIVDGQEVTVGDYIILDDKRGMVSEIHPSRLILRTESGTVQFSFPNHVMLGMETFAEGEIVVYPKPGNLMPILRSLCLSNGWKLAGSPTRHTISGRFESVESFLKACKHFGITFEDNLLVVPESSEPKSFISFNGFWVQPSGTLSQLVKLYGHHLPYKAKPEGISSSERWVINYGLQFDEFCEFFELSTELRGNDLIVKGGNDENGKAGD